MCPYARFQSAMFDPDTLIITYDRDARRAARPARAKADPKALGLGRLRRLRLCVQVCPTGIDIRDGLQYECIGCAACIDGCNQVMDKIGLSEGPHPLLHRERAAAERLGLPRQILARVAAAADARLHRDPLRGHRGRCSWRSTRACR